MAQEGKEGRGGKGRKLFPSLVRECWSAYNERRQRFSIIPGRKLGPFHMRETYDSGRRRDSAHSDEFTPSSFLSSSFFPFSATGGDGFIEVWTWTGGGSKNEGKCRLTNGSIDPPPASPSFLLPSSSCLHEGSFGLILSRGKVEGIIFWEEEEDRIG